MRKKNDVQTMMFSTISPEERVPADHPLRSIKKYASIALTQLDEYFDLLYASTGRPSIPPEQLLLSMILQILYSIRSERMLVEQLNYNILFRWFVGLNMDDAIWNHSVYSKNRTRLLSTDVARLFLESICDQARQAQLLSDDHFTVDGTLIEAWASAKSFRPKDEVIKNDSQRGGRNPYVDFKGQKRLNDTHVSTTDPDSRLYRKGKGKEAKLCFIGHVMMENRNGLVINTSTSKADGRAECNNALDMAEELPGRMRVTLGADKGYDNQKFVSELRSLNITPHVARKKVGSALDGRTTRHKGYSMSLVVRKRVEEIFGWMKTVGWVRKTKYRGIEKVDWMFTMAASVYNLVRMRNLLKPEMA